MIDWLAAGPGHPQLLQGVTQRSCSAPTKSCKPASANRSTCRSSVSPRCIRPTLRLCCQGVSPKRYLHPRRMNLARRTLLRVAADTDILMSIATRFWELGRFAVDYHTLSVEAPSTTLRSGRLR